MQDIHLARILFGGIAAGLVIIVGEYVLNAVLLAEHWAELRHDFGISQPGTAQYASGSILTLSYGVVLIWLYAAMRPRFRSDTKAAVVAAFTFWFIAYVLFLLSVWANGFVTFGIAIVSIVWGLFEAPLAALIGARVYGLGSGFTK
ncbi:MAG: hypothetical protein JJ901_04095 [Erythrobacter sp.]|uniref:hypothetical protein n=1 Tax=Erythrobacter sp. TaxID=1042 RepID=UPI001B0FAAE1|nr:hypothetical protein [Erythrobacter sp.]MBO6767473.1 hypothetical protein [Erythrobacter sp.]